MIPQDPHADLRYLRARCVRYKWCTHHEERKDQKGMRSCLIVFLSNLQVLRILCG